jgi:predicted Zn-dependent protease
MTCFRAWSRIPPYYEEQCGAPSYFETIVPIEETINYVVDETVLVIDIVALASNPALIAKVKEQLDATLESVAKYDPSAIATEFDQAAREKPG